MTLPVRSIQAEFSATLVDEWSRAGVRHCVISPGSRSSAMAIALLANTRMQTHLRLDERSGAFFALGLALSTREPVLIVTTSGTATTELHAAVVEADQARVPLVVVTADRPVELHHVGAPQTIDQSTLFGGSLRFHLDLPVAEEATRRHWRSFASRLVAEAVAGGRGPGPVHCNLAFREPMVGAVVALPKGRDFGRPWHEAVREVAVSAAVLDRFLDEIEGISRGVVIAGGTPLDEYEGILAFAGARGWPVLADARAIPRREEATLIAHADQFLRDTATVDRLEPEVIVHLGSPHASKTLMGWNERWAERGIPHLFVDPFGTYEDPERYGELFLAAEPNALLALSAAVDTGVNCEESWLQRWRECDAKTAIVLEQILDAGVLCEPAIAREVHRALTDDDTLFCSSSMPIRDVEWFAAARDDAPRVLANRGANGIDGVVSSILGVAADTHGRTIGLIGDLALLHDLSGFVWGSTEVVPNATLVLIDNAGGGIFSFLSYPGLVDRPLFERGFATPQRADLPALLRGFGVGVIVVESLAGLHDALVETSSTSGIHVIVARTDREANVEIHRAIAAAVADAIAVN